MKYVYIGKDEPLFGTIGEATTDTYGNCCFVDLDGVVYYPDERNVVKFDYFCERCNAWLYNSVLMWESVRFSFNLSPSIFEKVVIDKDFNEVMFWTKDGTWSRAIDSNGATWIIYFKTETSMYAQRLDQFLRESFYDNPQDIDNE